MGTEEKEDIKEGFRAAFPKEPVWMSGHAQAYGVSLDFIRISSEFGLY